ncbi:FRG domain-containing protein [Vibrio sp. CUB2]|uniref:FRG domain-containing protein n=1 Tax=Vibrio sp. CUB2 TaxID=2315233 RepID=UPI000769D8FA|nr:FRG domain-containing protein [Vibrio sp. CUB2]
MENNITDGLAGFIEKISKIPREKDHTLFFRGHANESFTALPAVFRSIPKSEPVEKYIDKESRLYHNMIMQCPDEFKDLNSTFDHLVKMQHYSLPTRLLDITTNPLVALYFACSGFIDEGIDGEVLVYQIPNNDIKFYNSDTVSVISNLAQINSDVDLTTDDGIGKLIHVIKNEKPYFLDKIDKSDLTRVVCVQPKQDNKRIIRQSGAFLLFAMGDEFKKNTSAKIPAEFLLKEFNISILNKDKEGLLASLEHIAISEATLFPEIDNVAKYLKNPTRAHVQSEQDGFIENNVKYIEDVVDELLQHEELIEAIKNNSKSSILQSDILEGKLTTVVIELMSAYDEQGTILLSNPKLFKTLVEHCYELIKYSAVEAAMA